MWIYQDKEFTDEMVGELRGFIYIITEIATDRKYIGQKVFQNKRAKPPLKGKTRRRITKVMSDWQSYYGSNEYLKELVVQNGKDAFKREIVKLCNSKAELNYFEAKMIFEADALLKEEYFNHWVSTRVHKKTLNGIKIDSRII